MYFPRDFLQALKYFPLGVLEIDLLDVFLLNTLAHLFRVGGLLTLGLLLACTNRCLGFHEAADNKQRRESDLSATTFRFVKGILVPCFYLLETFFT